MSSEARKEYDATLLRMFNEQIAKQPPEFQDIVLSGPERCQAEHDGFGCTLRTGHTCDHVAHGQLGYIHHRWNDSGAVSKDGVIEI